MAQIERIRYLLYVEEKSQRQVARELGISRNTVAKYKDQTEPPQYTRRRPRPAPVLTPEHKAEIERLLAENRRLPRKQRWIGHTIFLALKEQGYQGAESTVRRYIGQVRKRQARSEAYVPLEYEPGEVAEFDWGEAEMTVGRRVKAQLLCLRLRWSRMPFVLAYPTQKQEAMFDGISRGFAALGGVLRQLKSDNKVSLVQYDTCRYWVPVRYAGQKLTLKAYWDRIEVYSGLERIASHPRSYERGREVLDLDHYLEVLHRKPWALGQARPFRQAKLPPVYHQFRAELNRRQGPRGDRAFVEVLLLHRDFPASAVEAAVTKALALRAIDVRAVRHGTGIRDRSTSVPRNGGGCAGHPGAAATPHPVRPASGGRWRLMSRGLLIESHLRRLKLPTFRRLYKELAREAAEHNKTYEDYLLALLEQEVV